MKVNLDRIPDSVLDAELRRRARQRAAAEHRANFPVQGPMFGPPRADYTRVLVERRMAVRRKQVRVQAIAAADRLHAMWQLRPFDEATAHLVGASSESAGRSRQDDIDAMTAIAFSATQFTDDWFGPTGEESMALVALRALNRSFMEGETDHTGHWQPITHTETRRDGSDFKRYVTTQPHQISDVHQLDGGDRIIVAITMRERTDRDPFYPPMPDDVDGFYVIQAEKRWLDMEQTDSLVTFGTIYPGRAIPRKGMRFYYNPISFVRCTNPYDADDLAWRWASAARLTEDDSRQHAPDSDVGPDFLRPNRPSYALQQARKRANEA